MLERPSELAAMAFETLIASDDVELISDEGDLQIAGDDWTLVLEGDPVANALIALEDESGSPEAQLRAVISHDALSAMRVLDGEMDGQLTSILSDSPDGFARALAEILID